MERSVHYQVLFWPGTILKSELFALTKNILHHKTHCRTVFVTQKLVPMISNILETKQQQKTTRHNSLPSFMMVDRFQGIVLKISSLSSQIISEVLTRSHTSLVGMIFFPGVRINSNHKNNKNSEKKVYYSLLEVGGLNVKQKFIPPLLQECWNFATVFALPLQVLDQDLQCKNIKKFHSSWFITLCTTFALQTRTVSGVISGGLIVH